MIIKKKDISSILPTIINIIKLILELVNKLAKLILVSPNNSDVVVLVKVNTESLKECSKFKLSKIKTPERKNKLIKKDMNIKKDNFMFSLSIFLSVYNMF